MMDEHRMDNDGPVREFQLEGMTLYIIIAILLVVLAGVFYLGRRFERVRWTSGEAQAEGLSGETGLLGDPVDGGPVEEVPIEEQIDFFDTVPGDGNNAEPDREAMAPALTITPPAAAAQGSAGPFFIQVLAARDRRAAEALESKLDAAGFPARIYTETDGAGAWYKVQVGGYPDRDATEPVLEKLKQAGYKGAWTTRVD
ncbi:MAG: SPOR domain-containing protein [Acidobacteria bacterium]|uniref:SPOR domain-containing protein n=1 Tax=Candidatus Polarisedimenticola svalbardensis TaxID=2886004 RepID=A0A8J6Y7R7_9BACT|nr:SPOR domain-containing protein [Candidatus Polarisedimenticola svalbardensis]